MQTAAWRHVACHAQARATCRMPQEHEPFTFNASPSPSGTLGGGVHDSPLRPACSPAAPSTPMTRTFHAVRWIVQVPRALRAAADLLTPPRAAEHCSTHCCGRSWRASMSPRCRRTSCASASWSLHPKP